jgi:hypothetical protein
MGAGVVERGELAGNAHRQGAILAETGIGLALTQEQVTCGGGRGHLTAIEGDQPPVGQAQRHEAAAAEAKKNTTYSYGYNHIKYRFGNTHSRDEDTYYEDEYEDELPPIPTADSSSDWRTVERPVRKPKKTAVEKIMEEPELLEPPIEETSVWQTEGVWERER